ncbi:MAG: hypothetical protein ACI81L_000003 [Verrucomicrobiales bacterium]|jgi:hypothetical protein
MTLAEIPFSTTLQNVHPGGFFWNLERSERATQLVRFASLTKKLVIISNVAREANDYAERLRLSGVPVHVATDPASDAAVEAFRGHDVSALVATHEYVLAQGPTPAPMVVHLRTAASVRDYTRRLDAVPSAVHLSFVVAEDAKRAASLISHFGFDHGHGEPGDVRLDDVIDLTDTNAIATVGHARRRFPLGR